MIHVMDNQEYLEAAMVPPGSRDVELHKVAEELVAQARRKGGVAYWARWLVDGFYASGVAVRVGG
jgi:hypothetical protein